MRRGSRSPGASSAEADGLGRLDQERAVAAVADRGAPRAPERVARIDLDPARGAGRADDRERALAAVGERAFRGARAQRREHDAEHLEQRVRRRRDRDVVGRRFAARELPAPGERVQRVVVGEADAGDQAQQHRPGDDRGQRCETLDARLDRGCHERGRYPLGALGRGRGRG